MSANNALHVAVLPALLMLMLTVHIWRVRKDGFAVERSATLPDVMTMGKGLGGGFPVAAVAARAEITQAEPWSKPSFSSSSFVFLDWTPLSPFTTRAKS